MMLKLNTWTREIANSRSGDAFFTSLLGPIVLIMMTLLVGAVLVQRGSDTAVAVVGMMGMAIVTSLRQDELAVTFIVATNLYIDWYLGFGVVAPIMIIGLLIIFFLAHSTRAPWVMPPAIWLWVLFLILALFPAVRGLTILDGLYYYINIVLGALLWFWLGLVVARNIQCMRRLLKILACFGTLIAIHAFIQARTGVVVFASSRYDQYLSSISDFAFYGTNRIGSFLVNPDIAGTFFACLLFIPFGLLFDSAFWLEKALYLVEISCILLALFFTYSIGSWVSAGAGLFVFILLIGRMRYRILVIAFTCTAAMMIAVLFPSLVAVLFLHLNDPHELLLRNAAWQTGIRVIEAFPLTGIGLGRYVYLVRADPYRVPDQYLPLYHPHNSYLELAALGGLPLAILLLALLAFAFYHAFRNWMYADREHRLLFSGSIAAVVVVCVNSLSSPGWTLPPLASLGWLLLGSAASPLLKKSLPRGRQVKENEVAANNVGTSKAEGV